MITSDGLTPSDSKSADPSIELEAVAFVTRQFAVGRDKGAPDSQIERLKIHRYRTEPAKVSIAMGLTLNLGNFETARVDVSITVPCYREESDGAYSYARSWVEDRLQAEVDDIRKNKPSAY